MKTAYIAPLGAIAIALSFAPASAQESATKTWNGPYIGGSAGFGWRDNNSGESIRFDRDGNGDFDDAVTTTTGANAFAPGFCGGAANGNNPGAGCRNDDNGLDWAVQLGYDRQMGNIVAGIVLEGGKTDVDDSVSGFSTTPASYTMTRDIKYNAAARLRLGYSTPVGTLFYLTGGGAYAKVRNSFATTNTANAFTPSNSKEDAWGWVAGGGVDQKITDTVSIGVLYKYTRYKADEYVVNAGRGTAPATNPFLIGPAGSTDFARGSRFDTHSIMATAAFHF
ncbi:outer membrane beta-barrel protein [Sphingobium sp. H39-3-25]|uniref:outer membrane protein n=1 Tax=Sphingobium arseniciresistens TaxID=3030834 RepID=UPI0023B94F52|nr:outer membrane beta-barrel protein [Sphingobium arseniciresistens]